jgi:nitroreductase
MGGRRTSAEGRGVEGEEERRARCAREACRPLQPLAVTDALVGELVAATQPAPSRAGAGARRFEFVHGERSIEALKAALPAGAGWARTASLFVAVLGRRGPDERLCEARFEAGLATGFMIMRATDLGIVLEPLAGFDRAAVRAVLGLDERTELVALLAAGRYLADPVEEVRGRLARLDAERRPPL